MSIITPSHDLVRDVEILVKDKGKSMNTDLPTLAVVVNDQRGKQSVGVLYDTVDFSGWAYVVGILSLALEHARSNMQIEYQVRLHHQMMQQAQDQQIREKVIKGHSK